MAARYIALIPAYEPDRKMLGVIADLGKSGFDIVVVDDGSGTEYSELFEQAAEHLPGKSGKAVTLLIHDVNKGKGAALKTGLDFIGNFMAVRGEESDTVIVTVDADGQHLAGDAASVAMRAEKKPGTLILGSRKLGSKAPLRSRFGNAVTRNVFRAVTGTRIYDTQTGLRAFTADLIPEMLSIRGERYEYEINVLMEFAGRGIPVEEMEIDTVYIDGNASSHFNTLKDSCRVYKEIAGYALTGERSNTGSSGTGKKAILQAARFSASSFASFLIDYAVYALLLMIGPGLVFANVGARLISAAANYTINRKLVFRSDRKISTSALQYAALALLILAGNTAVLHTLVVTFGVGSMLAKIFTEVLFFLVSWTVQRYVVFYTPVNNEECGRTGAGNRFTVEYTAVRPAKLRSVRRKENA